METHDQVNAPSANHAGGNRKIVFGILAFLSLAIGIMFLPISHWLDSLREQIAALGWFAPVAFVIIYIVCTVLLIPGSALTIGAGALFGLLWGTLLAVIGSNLGAFLAYLLAKTVMRRRVEGWALNSPRFASVNEAVSRDGLKMVLLLRLSPVFPFTLLNYLIGLTRVSPAQFVVGSLLGMLPGTVAFVYIGSIPAAVAGASGGAEGVRLAFQIIGFLATVVLTVIITRRARAALREMPGGDSGTESRRDKK